MITATTSYSLSLRPQRPAAYQNASALPTGDSTDERQQAASGALDTLRGIVENGPRERKAQAEEKLKRLKEEMTALMRWGFASGATAQRSLLLAKELGSAAAQFSDAVSSGKNMPSVASTNQTAVVEKVVEERGVPEGEGNFLPQAYRDILNDDVPDAALHSGDKETVADFRSAAQQLQFMLEDAARQLHKDGRPAAFTDLAKDSLASIDHILSRLDGTSASMPSLPAPAAILLL